jgi:hypothetical protein
LNLKQKTLTLIIQRHKESGGHNGMSVIKLSEVTGIDRNDIKPILRELHYEGKIKVREGINHKLIFYNG